MKLFTHKTFEDYKKPLALVGMAFMVSLTILVIMGVIALIMQLSTSQRGMNTITVTGNGEVMMAPDSARFTFGLTERGDDVADAQGTLSERVQGIIDVLDEFIAPEDVRTVNYNVSPRYDWVDGERRDRGFEIMQQTEITVRNLDDAGAVLALLGDARVNNLNGPIFEIEDEAVYERQAHTEALRDARLQAEATAEELGVRLKRVVGIYNNYQGGFPMPYQGDMMRAEMSVASAPSPQLSPGENTVTASVDVTYKIR